MSLGDRKFLYLCTNLLYKPVHPQFLDIFIGDEKFNSFNFRFFNVGPRGFGTHHYLYGRKPYL